MAGRVTPNTPAAMEFLEKWEPEGPWHLTCITTDKKTILTESFTDIEDAKSWVEQHNGERNLYFHVNRTMGLLRQKARRSDIAELNWLHVDIDPRAGEDMEEERDRALSLLKSPPSDVPKPTVIIDSGGGYQGFWKLDVPFTIDGQETLYEEAKRWNLQLELIFGADNCHNVDRIMRLPGTVNLPDERKKAKGRVPALAKLITFNLKRIYPLEKFTRAQMLQSEADDGGAFSAAAKQSVQIKGSVQRLSGVEDLDEWNVPDRVKVIIVQGEDPDNPKETDNSRSAWLFDVLCNMVRAGVPDEVIFSVVTDPDFAISASVIDKGPEAENYALRQIGRAKEHGVDPNLTTMNDTHAVILNAGGKCLVVEEVAELVGPQAERTRLTLQSFTDIRNRYLNRQVQIGQNKNGSAITEPLGNWWLKSEHRRQYKSIVFAPGRETPGHYNLWRGFAVIPRAGDCSLYLNHLKENICRDNNTHYLYLLRWMARCVQEPDSQGHVAVVLRGSQGVGKGMFCQQFGSLFGRHFLHVSDPKHLVGSFNAHLRDCVVLFGDEAFFAGDKRHESVLKTLITESLMQVERKGIDAETCPNYAHVILASNSQWVIPAGGNDRRYFVLDVSDEKRQDVSYFQAINQQMNRGGKEALLDMLLKMDLSKFEVRDFPRTAALREQTHMSLPIEAEWWLGRLMEGQILVEEDTWPEEMQTEQVLAHFVSYTRDLGIRHHVNATTLGQFIHRMSPGLGTVQKRCEVVVRQPNGEFKDMMKRKRVYLFPDLMTCRRRWDDEFGKEEWPEPVDEEDGKDSDESETPF